MGWRWRGPRGLVLGVTEQCPSSDVPNTQQWFAQSSDIRGDGAAESSSSSSGAWGGGHSVHNCPGGMPKKRESRLQFCGTEAVLWGSPLPQNMQTEACNIDMGKPHKLSPPTHCSPPLHPRAAPPSSPHSPPVGTALPRSQPRPGLAPPPAPPPPRRSRLEWGCRVQQQRCQWGGAQHPPPPPRRELCSLWPFCDQTPGSGEITAEIGMGMSHSCPWLCPGHTAWGGDGGGCWRCCPDSPIPSLGPPNQRVHSGCAHPQKSHLRFILS